MRALVTGANGLIGANIVRELLREGVEVTGLVRASADVSSLTDLPVDLAFGDVLDPASLKRAVAGQDLVFHTAVAFSYWGHEPAEMTRTAVEGSRNVLAAAAAAGVRRVVMTSSSVTLGASYDPQVRDETASAANDPGEPAYVLAKIAQERQAGEVARQLGDRDRLRLPDHERRPLWREPGAQQRRGHQLSGRPAAPDLGGRLQHRLGPGRGRRPCPAGRLRKAGTTVRRSGGENLDWAQIHGLIAELSGAPPPTRRASAVACYGLAVAEEARARLTGKPPLATRAQARMVGRYYWYSHARAAALGYRARPARQALAEAIAWLAAGPHVSRETRAGLRLGREVHAARIARLAAERLAPEGAAA